jgi:hypothetical protein
VDVDADLRVAPAGHVDPAAAVEVDLGRAGQRPGLVHVPAGTAVHEDRIRDTGREVVVTVVQDDLDRRGHGERHLARDVVAAAEVHAARAGAHRDGLLVAAVAEDEALEGVPRDADGVLLAGSGLVAHGAVRAHADLGGGSDLRGGEHDERRSGRDQKSK